MARKNGLYIVRQSNGGFAVRKPGSMRASATAKTEAKAIKKARTIDPSAEVYAEITHDPTAGGRDRWKLIKENL